MMFADSQNQGEGRVRGNVRPRTSTGSQSIMVIPTDKTVNTRNRQDLSGHNALTVYTGESLIK